MPKPRRARIYVVAGTNGAGKSSIAGAMFRQTNVAMFDPDAAAARVRTAIPGLTEEQASSIAWKEGKRLLERAIDERLDYAFETTLGGRTITTLLVTAANRGIEVRVWYAGLASPDLHIQRVRARVKRGGHAIAELKIRERFDSSRANLVRLLPGLMELRLFDNSTEADPHAGVAPEQKLILHMERGRIVDGCRLDETPEWAKPIVMAAWKLARR